MLENNKNENSLKIFWDEVQQSEIKISVCAVQTPPLKGLKSSKYGPYLFSRKNKWKCHEKGSPCRKRTAPARQQKRTTTQTAQKPKL